MRCVGHVNEELHEERDSENGEGGPGYQIHSVHHAFYKKLGDRWSEWKDQVEQGLKATSCYAKQSSWFVVWGLDECVLSLHWW